MREYELRFRLTKNTENSVRKKMRKLGFRLEKKYAMSDIIFEDRNWRPGDKAGRGYYVIRIRFRKGHEPVVELKEKLSADTWEETTFKTDDIRALIKMFNKGFTFSKIISKVREEHKMGNALITIDDVKHLGKFIEIEAPRKEALPISKELGFALGEKQKDYGYLIFQLMKDRKLLFTSASISQELSNFKS